MDVVGRKIENQVQFWSLLGPFLVLLSITVLLFKVSIHWYFPVSALIGIPLCVKWKMKGMAVALGCLLCLSGIGYQNLELDDRYWHVGLALTMAFSFIVLTLSLEEAQGLINKLQVESQSRLDNFSLLAEKWKSAEQEWTTEREKSRSDVASLTHEIAKTQEDKQTFYKLAQLAKDELVQVRGQHEVLLQDFLYKKQQIAQLHERLEETEMTVQGFVNSDAEKQVQSLIHRVTTLESEKEILKAKVALTQTEQVIWQQEKEQFSQELQESQEREKRCLLDHEHFEQEKQEQQKAFQLVQNKCLFLEQEKNILIQAQMGLQQQFEQVRHLETQHRQTLQQLQKKIDDLELKLKAEEQQKEALQLLQKELEEQRVLQEKQFKQREEQYKNGLKQLTDQLQEQKNKADIEFKNLQQQALQQHQQEKQALEQEIKAIQECYQKAEENFLQVKQEGEDKHERLIQVQQKVESLNEELSQQQALVQQANEYLQRLESLKVQLEEALQHTQDELKVASHKIEPIQKYQGKLPYAPGNTRRIEAMYVQLKEQFQEKCAVLDTTRRELFYANEELLKWQKEYEEEKVFGQSMNEAFLQRNLLQLEHYQEQMQQQAQQEIDELAQLVGHLLHQLTIQHDF